jgi:hypothetical protein
MLSRAHITKACALALGTLIACPCCGARRKVTANELPSPQILPLRTCVATGRVVDVGLEVVPGLVLERVSGLPLGPARSAQHTIQFHWTATDSLVVAPDIEMDVWAKSRVGKTRIGIARLSDQQPLPQLWRPHVCYPVSVELALPLAQRKLEWELWVAVRAVGVSASEVALGVAIMEEGGNRAAN